MKPVSNSPRFVLIDNSGGRERKGAGTIVVSRLWTPCQLVNDIIDDIEYAICTYILRVLHESRREISIESKYMTSDIRRRYTHKM